MLEINFRGADLHEPGDGSGDRRWWDQSRAGSVLRNAHVLLRVERAYCDRVGSVATPSTMSRLERFWPGIIMALVGQGCSASVQRGNTKNLPKRRSAKMLAFGWLVI